MQIAFRWTIILVIALAASAKGEVWYERKLSPVKQSRYTTAYNEWGRGESEEKLRKELQGHNWELSPKTIKVELLYDHSSQPPQPYIKETVLGIDKVALAEKKNWREKKGPKLTEGIEIPGMKGGPKQIDCNGSYHLYGEIIGKGIECVGCVSQQFQGLNDRTVGVAVYEVVGKAPEPSEFLHDFLRNTIKFKHKPFKTEFGTIISSESKWMKLNHRSFVQWIADPYFVTINANGVDPMEIARIFGKKFPSSLPSDLKIDKTTWGREEFELGLQRVASSLSEQPWAGPTVPLQRATEYVFCPIEWRPKLGNEDQDTKEVLIEKNKKIYDELVRWWKENKENTYWDDKLNMLVAKGQTPADVKAEADKRDQEAAKIAKEEQDAVLATPMTKEEIAKATAKLLSQFAEGKTPPEWRKGKDNEWVRELDYSAKGGEHTILTITGPTVTTTKNLKTPLKAVFIERYEHVGSPPDSLVKDRPRETKYEYNRLEDVWEKQ